MRSTKTTIAGVPSLDTASHPTAMIASTTPPCTQSETNRPTTWRTAARRKFTRSRAFE
jgi:hypothetical protein